MDLMKEFEKRRGFTPAVVKPQVKEDKTELPDVREVLQVAFAGGLITNYLIPVLPEYQSIFGDAIWICPDEYRAQQKQLTDRYLAFAPYELADILTLAANDLKNAAGIVAAKRTFLGTVAG